MEASTDSSTENSIPAPTSQSKEKDVVMALLCYLWLLILIPLLTDAKSDPYVKFHVKQGLVLLIASFGSMVLGVIPILGWILIPFYSLFILILAIIGIINALTGKEKALPLIGKYADKISI